MVRINSGIAAVILAAVPLFAVTVNPSPALATGCYASTCTGQDPIQEGCSSDARTIDSYSLNSDFYVELRYSAACYAAWARVTNTWYSNGGSQNIFVQIMAYSCSAATASCRAGQQSYQAFYGVDYTDMESFTYWVRACDTPWPTGDPYACTAQH